MALDRNTLITQLKTWWSQQDSQQAPEGLYGKALDLTAWEVIRKSGGLSLRKDAFTTVADQQAYDIPTDRVIVRIPGWTSSWPSTDLGFGNDIRVNAYGNLSDLGNSRSITLIDEMEAQQNQMSRCGRRSWDFVDGQIWLTPIPSGSGDAVVYEYFNVSDGVSRVPPQYEYCLICGARAKVARGVLISLMKHGLPRTDHGLQLSDRAMQIQNTSDQAALEYRNEKNRIWLDMGGVG